MLNGDYFLWPNCTIARRRTFYLDLNFICVFYRPVLPLDCSIYFEDITNMMIRDWIYSKPDRTEWTSSHRNRTLRLDRCCRGRERCDINGYIIRAVLYSGLRGYATGYEDDTYDNNKTINYWVFDHFFTATDCIFQSYSFDCFKCFFMNLFTTRPLSRNRYNPPHPTCVADILRYQSKRYSKLSRQWEQPDRWRNR